MARLISFVLWIVIFLRITIAVFLASIGISTIFATGFRMIFQPPQGDFASIVIWMVKPLAVGIILLVIAFWVSKSLTRLQKFIVVTIIFLISVMSLYSLISGMDWTAWLQAQNPAVFSAPIDMLKQITTMLQGVTGV